MIEAGEMAEIGTAVIGLAGLIVLRNEWRSRREELEMQSRGWLYIPPPPRDQCPLEPVFWVYPPVEGADGSCDLVVAGKVVNAGPADAFSVRIFADRESRPQNEEDRARLQDVLLKTVTTAISPEFPDRDIRDLYDTFVADHKTRDYYTPLICKGGESRFVVVAHYDEPTPYLRRIAADPRAASKASRDWEQDGLQAHPVSAVERTALGHQVEFGPGDLCAPFEKLGR